MVDAGTNTSNPSDQITTSLGVSVAEQQTDETENSQLLPNGRPILPLSTNIAASDVLKPVEFLNRYPVNVMLDMLRMEQGDASVPENDLRIAQKYFKTVRSRRPPNKKIVVYSGREVIWPQELKERLTREYSDAIPKFNDDEYESFAGIGTQARRFVNKFFKKHHYDFSRMDDAYRRLKDEWVEEQGVRDRERCAKFLDVLQDRHKAAQDELVKLAKSRQEVEKTLHLWQSSASKDVQSRPGRNPRYGKPFQHRTEIESMSASQFNQTTTRGTQTIITGESELDRQVDGTQDVGTVSHKRRRMMHVSDTASDDGDLIEQHHLPHPGLHMGSMHHSQHVPSNRQLSRHPSFMNQHRQSHNFVPSHMQQAHNLSRSQSNSAQQQQQQHNLHLSNFNSNSNQMPYQQYSSMQESSGQSRNSRTL